MTDGSLRNQPIPKKPRGVKPAIECQPRYVGESGRIKPIFSEHLPRCADDAGGIAPYQTLSDLAYEPF